MTPRSALPAAAAACSADAVLTLDLSGRTTWANAAAERLLGLPSSELVGRPVSELMDDAAAAADLPAPAGPRSVAAALRHRSGRLVPVEARLAPLVQEGCRTGTVVSVRDVVVRLPGAPDAGEPPRRRPEVSLQVREQVARLRAEGASLRTVAAALNAADLLTPEGKRWHPRSLARLLPELVQR